MAARMVLPLLAKTRRRSNRSRLSPGRREFEAGQESPHHPLNLSPRRRPGSMLPRYEQVMAGMTLPLLEISERRRNGSRPEPVLGPREARTRGPGRQWGMCQFSVSIWILAQPHLPFPPNPQTKSYCAECPDLCSAGLRALLRLWAVLTKAIWEKAWGKFPTSLLACGSYSSESSPTSLRKASSL
jgi:hypothetical protein